MKVIFEEVLPGCKNVLYSPEITNNPYLELLYEDKSLSEYTIESFNSVSLPKYFFKDFIYGNKRIIHHHWFSANSLKGLLILPFKLIFLRLYKISGSKLVWTIHNEYPHDKKFFKYNMFLRNSLAKLADLIHVHGKNDIEILKKTYNIKKKQFRVYPHPPYKVERRNRDQSISFLKENLNLKLTTDSTIILFFGQLYRYKGIIEIVDIYENIEIKNNIKIIFAGKVDKYDEELVQRLNTVSEHSHNIVLINRFIEEEELSYLFGAADYVLFNYKTILTSGGVVMAKSHRKKVIAPDKGNITEYTGNDDILFRSQTELSGILKKLADS